MGGVVWEDNRDRAVTLGIRHLVVVGGVMAAVEPVGVDLGDAGEAVLAKMGSGLAHCLGGDLIVAGEELGIGDGEGGDHRDAAGADAVEERDALHRAVSPGELVEEAVPDQVMNHDHRSAPGSWGHGARHPCG